VIFVSLGFSHTLSFVKDPSHWEVVDPLPSYGRGIDLPGGRYRSLINGYMLHDVVITGIYRICNLRVFFFFFFVDVKMLFSRLLYDSHTTEMTLTVKLSHRFFFFFKFILIQMLIFTTTSSQLYVTHKSLLNSISLFTNVFCIGCASYEHPCLLH
jgi:hypothetical protein